MIEMSPPDHFETWLNQLDDLPDNPYQWVTQIAYELAFGVTRGFWMTTIATHTMAGWRPHIGLDEYVKNREAQAVFNNVCIKYPRRNFSIIVESLALAGFCERTRLSSGNKAWLTPKAFELLKDPQHVEAEHD